MPHFRFKITKNALLGGRLEGRSSHEPCLPCGASGPRRDRSLPRPTWLPDDRSWVNSSSMSELGIENITVDGVEYNMTLWDTAGQEDYERLRPLAYPNTKCFLVCFSVDDSSSSYDNVVVKWVPEVRHHNPHTPIVLVATKIDLRSDRSLRCYTTQDGKKLKRRVRAQGYVECSAKTTQGLADVFVEAIRIYKKTKFKSRTINCVLL
jgi:small GTP-binding protein